MKNFLPNLLLGFALALCALVALQWHREAKLRQELQQLTGDIRKHRVSVQSLEGALKRAETERGRIDALRNKANDVAKSNQVEIVRLKGELQNHAAEFERLTKQVAAYQAALDTANEGIKTQNTTINTQNEELKKLAAERNEVVVKYNNMAEEYNDLVTKWNAQQEQLSKGGER